MRLMGSFIKLRTLFQPGGEGHGLMASGIGNCPSRRFSLGCYEIYISSTCNGRSSPAMVARQPAMVARQPAMVARQPAMVARQPAMVARQPAMVARQPVMVTLAAPVLGIASHAMAWDLCIAADLEYSSSEDEFSGHKI